MGGPGSLSASRGLGEIDQHPRGGVEKTLRLVWLPASRTPASRLQQPRWATGKVTLWAKKHFGHWTKPRTGTHWQQPRGGSAAPADLGLRSAAALERSLWFASQACQHPRPGRGSPALDGPLCCSVGTPPALMPLLPNPDTAHPYCRGYPHTDGGGVSRKTWGYPLHLPEGLCAPPWVSEPGLHASLSLQSQLTWLRRREHRRVWFPVLRVSVLECVSVKKHQIL